MALISAGELRAGDRVIDADDELLDVLETKRDGSKFELVFSYVEDGVIRRIELDPEDSMCEVVNR